MPRSLLLTLAALSTTGCYATLSASYFPSPMVHVAEVPAADVYTLNLPGEVPTHLDAIPAFDSRNGIFTFGVSLGFALDLYGIGAAFGWGGHLMPVAVAPLKSEQPQFQRFRLDGDLPFFIVKNVLKPRLTLIYDRTTKVNWGDGTGPALTATGNAFFAGFTLSTVQLAQFAGVSLSAGPAYTMQSVAALENTGHREYPAWTATALGAQVHLTATGIPTGFIFDSRPAPPPEPSKDKACTRHVTESCGYGPFGMKCNESTSCY